VPHTIPFSIRAKIFQHLLEIEKQNNSDYNYAPIVISRNYILENAFDRIFVSKRNLKAKLAIKF
jgi:hypothetical protein